MFVIAVVAALAAPVQTQSPINFVERAVEAMGGERALRSVRTVQSEFYGMAWGMGQSETAESPPRATQISGRLATDYQAMRRDREQEARAVTGQVTRTRRVTGGGIGMVRVGDNPAGPDAPGQVIVAERLMRREPDRLLLAAFDNRGALSPLPPREFRGDMMDGVRFALGPDTVALYFDRGNGNLTVMEAVTDDPILGDRRTAVMFTRWTQSGPIKLPRQVDVTANGEQLEHWIFTTVTVNEAIDPIRLAIPDSIAARANRTPPAPPAITVTMVDLGGGVWRAEGGTHHSLVVEQGNDLIMVEAPQSERRAQAVLDTLRGRMPNRRVTMLINTHHHWDHSGGLRAPIAANIPIVTHARNAAFVRRVAAAPRTIAPDEQARRRRQPTVRTLTDSMVIGRYENPITVYALPTAHAEGLVAVWVPSVRVLFTADVVNPTANATLPAFGSSELVSFARARGLQPDKYVGAHGVVTPWADLERAAGGQ